MTLPTRPPSLALWIAVAIACGTMRARSVAADPIETSVHQLADVSNKIRFAAALSLARSGDPRAVGAIALALTHDEDAKIRLVAALALARMVDARTSEDARALALTAIDAAVRSDPDVHVRDTAIKSRQALAALRGPRTLGGPAGAAPPMFINIDATIDQSKRLSTSGGERVMRIVRQNVEHTGYATSWPGGLPTAADLTTHHARAYIITSTIKKIEISPAGSQTEIACAVEIRIAPWTGTDGGESWEANHAASARGSARAVAGSRERDIQGGVRDCIDAVVEDVTSRQVIPFMKGLTTVGS